MIIFKTDTMIMDNVSLIELSEKTISIRYSINNETLTFCKIYKDNQSTQKAFNKIGRAIKFRKRMVQI